MQLGVQILPEPGADLDELDRLGRSLRAELVELDVDRVVAGSSDAVPDGAKGVDVAAISELVVTLTASGGVLATVVAGVRDWLARRAGAHRITMTIEGDTVVLERATAEERANLVAAFVARHGG